MDNFLILLESLEYPEASQQLGSRRIIIFGRMDSKFCLLISWMLFLCLALIYRVAKKRSFGFLTPATQKPVFISGWRSRFRAKNTSMTPIKIKSYLLGAIFRPFYWVLSSKTLKSIFFETPCMYLYYLSKWCDDVFMCNERCVLCNMLVVFSKVSLLYLWKN